MYWRKSIPIVGGLKYNITSEGKDYISYRKKGFYMREPIADIKRDIKNLFQSTQSLDIGLIQKKIKDSFDSYDDAEIFNQIEILKQQFNLSEDNVVDVVTTSIFDGVLLSIDQLNHAKGIFSQVKCSNKRRQEINSFLDNEIKRIQQQTTNNKQQFLLYQRKLCHQIIL